MSVMPQSGTIIAFPFWRDNPYLNMLYLAPRAAGWNLSRSTTIRGLFSQLDGVTAGDIIHIHWTSPIVQKAGTVEEASARLDWFVRTMTTALDKGAKLVWTVHNVMPHECPFPEQELELVRFLLDSASIVHVLSASTVSAAKHLYEIPMEKTVVIPHASYLGIYDETLSRDEARARRQLGAGDVAVLFFGQMRAYKGLDILLAAMEYAAGTRENLVLLLAGKTKPEDIAEIELLLPPSIRVIREHEFVPDEATQEWFAAADLTVFPYRNVLNSGSVHLSATFGIPTVLPRQHHLSQQFGDEAWVSFFDPEDPVRSLSEVIVSFDDPERSRSASARAYAEAYTPYDMSRDYAALTRSLAVHA